MVVVCYLTTTIANAHHHLATKEILEFFVQNLHHGLSLTALYQEFDHDGKQGNHHDNDRNDVDIIADYFHTAQQYACLLYTSPSPRDRG